MARVLVADDEVAVRRLLRVVLEREGHLVIEAGNGRQVINAIERNECDVLLLDLMMPDLSGWEVLEYLRAQRPATLSCVIVVTAAHEKELHERLGTDPPFRIMTKPFEYAHVVTAVRKCLAVAAGAEPANAEKMPLMDDES